MTAHRFSLILFLGACAGNLGFDAKPPSVDDFTGKADDDGTARAVYCQTTAADSVNVMFTPNGGAFDVAASSANGNLFTLAGQRPSLNVAVDTGSGKGPNEFVDFRPSGLTAIPAIGTPRFELTLAPDTKTLTYGDSLQLNCSVGTDKLLAYLGIAPTYDLDVDSVTSIGFDIDDTLLFSTPTFTRAFATGGTPAPTDTVFWTQANSCD